MSSIIISFYEVFCTTISCSSLSFSHSVQDSSSHSWFYGENQPTSPPARVACRQTSANAPKRPAPCLAPDRPGPAVCMDQWLVEEYLAGLIDSQAKTKPGTSCYPNTLEIFYQELTSFHRTISEPNTSRYPPANSPHGKPDASGIGPSRVDWTWVKIEMVPPVNIPIPTKID